MFDKPQKTTITGAEFLTTEWSVVLQAGQDKSPAAAQALETLCRTYWLPLYTYARRDGLTPQDAQDATQEFIVNLLRRNDLASVSSEKGRFRSFLLASLKNFLVSRWRMERAVKRGGQNEFVVLESAEAEKLCQPEMIDQLSPEKAFDRRWAMTVMAHALDRLRAEHQSPQQARFFVALQPVLAGSGRMKNQAAMAGELGVTPGALATAATRLRHRYRTLIEDEVRRTLEKPGDLAEELRVLREVWT
jgi:DNA-directed RNA polymerase specialized sigma24 family protein